MEPLSANIVFERSRFVSGAEPTLYTMDHHDEALLNEIMRELEIDHQYMRFFLPQDSDDIARVRRLGRKAGRTLGWKIRTMQTNPAARDDGKVVVLVTVIESTPEEEKRMNERTSLIVSQIDVREDR